MTREKYCGGCDRSLVLRKFHRHSGTTDGLQVWCIECLAKKREESIERNKAKWAKNDPYDGAE